MAKIYLRKIRSGGMELSQVPERWRAEVAALLAAAEEQGGTP